jgi:hypothetical protein
MAPSLNWQTTQLGSCCFNTICNQNLAKSSCGWLPVWLNHKIKNVKENPNDGVCLPIFKNKYGKKYF